MEFTKTASLTHRGTKCFYENKCIWVGVIKIPSVAKPNVYFNKSETQHICKHLHPGETEEDLFVRIGVYDTI